MSSERHHRPRAAASAFLQAAQAFDSELASFHHAAEATLRGPLYSAKQLERAVSSLNQVAQCEQRLGVASKTLGEAIHDAHQLQLEVTQKLTARAQAISVRNAQFDQLMAGYRALGEAALSLNREAADILRKKKELGDSSPAALADELRGLVDKLSAVSQIAQDLTETARGEDFEEIARQADSVRQQLVAARTKLALILRAPSS